MKTWQDFAPACGWDQFDGSRALTAAFQDLFSPASWHYSNFTADSSVWESRLDGSLVRVHYSGERVVEFAAQTGIGSETIRSLVTRFHFVHVTPAA
jgi:hypothetical protein